MWLITMKALQKERELEAEDMRRLVDQLAMVKRRLEEARASLEADRCVCTCSCQW